MTIFMVDSNLGRSWRLESHHNGGSPQGAALGAVTPPYGDVIKPLRYIAWVLHITGWHKYHHFY